MGRSRMAVDTVPASESHTRHCSRCWEHKSIRGVWYLVQKTEETAPLFYCESCFAVNARMERAPEPVLGGPGGVVDAPALANELEPGARF